MKKFERRQFIKAGLSTTAGLVLSATMGSKALYAESGFAPQAQDLNITQFGAVGDGKALNTSAIQKAIDTCSRKGGGRVIVPKGTFMTGGILLKSNVNLHLEKDAVILGSPHMKDYPVRELMNDARYKKYLRYALLFAQGEKNISVSGEGTLNGNAQQGCKLGEFVDKSHASKRPCLLWFNECENILVQDITYKNSAMWTETYSQCRNVHVNKITVTENYFFNADGCNMLDCDGFIIENCNINAMDDGICLKGYTNKGCSNGIIRNNKVRSICNGIKMGTDSSGGFRDIVIENNEVWQTGISGIALELTDGGIMENITVSNIKMNVVGTPIFIMLSNRNRPVSNDLTVPIGKLSNIRIKDIDAIVDKYETYNDLERKYFDLTPYASSITGFPGYYVEDVAIDNVKIEIRGGFPERTSEDALREIPEAERRYPENRMFGTLPCYGFFVRHARGIRMNNVSVSIAQKDGRPAFLLDDTHDSKFDDINVKSASGTAAFAVKPNCSGLQLDLA